MKKCLSLILVLCIILAIVPVLAEEAEIKNNGTFNYVLQGDRILIKGLTEDKFLAPERTISNYEREDYTRTVTIPREIGGTLVELEKEAFRGVESVGTIIFEEGITEIPLGLCREMPNLKKVVLPKSLKKIGWSAFYDCQKLSTINLPENLEIIDEYAFANCKSIEEVILPEGIKTIGNSAFGSTNIKTLEMPMSVVELGNYTFSRCENLTFVNLNNVEILGQGTFSNCTRLEKVVHNGKLTQLGSFAFENCYELEDIDVKCVKKFDTAVFRGTEKIKYLNLQGIEEVWTVEDRYVVEGEKPYFKGETYQQTKGIIRSPLASSSFSQMNGLEMVRINTENLDTHGEKGVLFFDTPKLKNIIFENFTPALTGKWLCCQYDLKKPRNEGLTLYGNEDVKEYAESIGVIYKELIEVEINGERIDADTPPYIKNNRTMVPMRAIFEALGAEVVWDNAVKTAIGKKDGVEIKFTIGENVLYKNGEAIELDCAAEITNDRTMVPVRAISEAFDYLVEWNNETKTVEIVAPYHRTDYVYDEDGQITGAKDGQGNYLHYDYLYDESGNVVRVWEKTIIKNSDRLFEYTYNEKGQRISKGVCRDWWMDALYGGPIDKEVVFTEVERYFYDEAGKIAYAESPDGIRTNYIYNEKGKLSRKESENGKVLAKYFYNEDGVLSYKEEY